MQSDPISVRRGKGAELVMWGPRPREVSSVILSGTGSRRKDISRPSDVIGFIFLK